MSPGMLATLLVGFTCMRTGGSSSASLHWENRVVPWALSSRATADITDRSAIRAAIVGSFDTWEAVDCSDLDFNFLGEGLQFSVGFRPEGPNTNVVAFIGAWVEDVDTIALTLSKFNSDTGALFDSDIILNDQHFTFTIPQVTGCDPSMSQMMDLENTMTHEVGHLLGLDHPPKTDVFRDVTMFADAPACQTTKRSLDRDDVLGICTIYPTGESAQQCPAPEVAAEGCSCHATRSPTSIAELSLLCLALIPFLRAKGSRSGSIVRSRAETDPSVQKR